MYTVLIQSKNTYENCRNFHPLLTDAIESGKIGICQWIESGTNIETAVPGLYDLIEKKNIWRAIIVQTELDDKSYPSTTNNPYDFKENENRTGLTVENGHIIDCEAPLIRLTHLLGGMPTPELQFEETIKYDERYGEDAIPRVVFNKVKSQDADAVKNAYEQWTISHTLQGPPPSEIILVTAQKNADGGESGYSDVSNSWSLRTEAQSSTFWRRNLYPHICRFLVFDFDPHGRMRQQRDYFHLWTAILLLAINDTDPDALQAHRLYHLNLIINKDAAQVSFQNAVDRLNKANYLLKKSLADEEKKDYEVITEIPNYAIGVPVGFELPKASELRFDKSKLALIRSSTSDDIDEWSSYTIRANNEIKLMLRSTDRFLDQAADQLRRQSKYYEHEVYKLSPYQEEDMNLKLETEYDDILELQGELPTGQSEKEETAETLYQEVVTLLHKRASLRQIVLLVGIVLFALALCLAPGIVPGESYIWYPAVLLSTLLALVLSTFFVLVFQRKTIITKILQYQHLLQSIASELNSNSGAFSRFLSEIATHIRGKSFLDIMHEKQQKHDSSYYFKVKHIKAIEALLSKIALWSVALQAEVDMGSAHALENYDDDPEVDYDSLYSLATEKTFYVPLNRTGVELTSPFEFVQRIEIEREEIYDDAK